MKSSMNWLCRAAAGMLLGGAALVTPQAQAVVDGIPGPTFNLTAQTFNITLPDGTSAPMWGYNGQYPGPTLIVNQGDTVTITLTNQNVPLPVSIVFPGQMGVTATGGATGVLTQEVVAGNGSVTYTFTATNPGTYLYESGTNPELEQEMGLFGAIVVHPAGFNKTPTTNANGTTSRNSAQTAYGVGTGTDFDYEYLFVLSELDPNVHLQAGAGNFAAIDNSAYHDTVWFINGRAGPDTLSAANVPWLPHQPYNALPRTHPGEKVLIRLVGGGRKSHPFHHHGENSVIIAQDGRLFDDPAKPGADADLGRSDYTILTKPGQTYDAIWRWTGKALGWDVFGDPAVNGHTCVDTVNNDTGAPTPDGHDDTTWEWCANHGRTLAKIGIVLPQNQDLTLGGFWSGSPLLGASGNLPPGEGGLNGNNAYVFIWHSHTEKELTVNDIFPGGLLTFMFVEPYFDNTGAPLVIPR